MFWYSADLSTAKSSCSTIRTQWIIKNRNFHKNSLLYLTTWHRVRFDLLRNFSIFPIEGTNVLCQRPWTERAFCSRRNSRIRLNRTKILDIAKWKTFKWLFFFFTEHTSRKKYAESLSLWWQLRTHQTCPSTPLYDLCLSSLDEAYFFINGSMLLNVLMLILCS